MVDNMRSRSTSRKNGSFKKKTDDDEGDVKGCRIVVMDTGNDRAIKRADTKMDSSRSIFESGTGRFSRVFDSRLSAQADSESDGAQACQSHPRKTHDLPFGRNSRMRFLYTRRLVYLLKASPHSKRLQMEMAAPAQVLVACRRENITDVTSGIGILPLNRLGVS
jgi:hypothetical protein